MTPQRFAKEPPVIERPQVGDEAMPFLNHLRLTAMQCRAKPRTDLFRACALLQTGQYASRDAHAEALMRCLPEAMGKPARLHAPGTSELTFDEKWLVQLARACRAQDACSIEFLLTSRVGRQNRRLIGYLVGHVAACLAVV